MPGVAVLHSGISGLEVQAVAARHGIFRHFLRACSPMAQLVTCLITSTAKRPSIIPSLSQKRDRKSTRLNSSHSQISYAVFCLKKKKNNKVSPPKQNDLTN